MYFFFVQQKTAYGMRISDWSSDVCSSDLPVGAGHGAAGKQNRHVPVVAVHAEPAGVPDRIGPRELRRVERERAGQRRGSVGERREVAHRRERTRAVMGKSVDALGDRGGRGVIKKKTTERSRLDRSS